MSRLAFKGRGLRIPPVVASVLLLLAMVAFGSVMYTGFFSAQVFLNLLIDNAFLLVVAVGMTFVILTGGIDLSVGSVMGLAAIVAGLVLQGEGAWWLAIGAGLATGLAAGAVNGVLIAWLGLPPFVVTLGTLSVGRSLAVVLSQNKMIYEFGPDADTIFAIGGGQMLGIANPVWVLLALTAIFSAVLHLTRWGRHLYAIGGNEQAALLTGVPVARVKLAAYIVSAMTAALAAVLIIGWQGSAINALGAGYELRVIASTVIGGANLMGGEGGAYGAFIGAALIEVIRNSLLMAGVDSNWQGTFVGIFIVLAVLLEKLRGRRRA
jgi:ribose transport system permease protein